MHPPNEPWGGAEHLSANSRPNSICGSSATVWRKKFDHGNMTLLKGHFQRDNPTCSGSEKVPALHEVNDRLLTKATNKIEKEVP
jgi:hypothetical protein